MQHTFASHLYFGTGFQDFAASCTLPAPALWIVGMISAGCIPPNGTVDESGSYEYICIEVSAARASYCGSPCFPIRARAISTRPARGFRATTVTPTDSDM